MFDKIQYAHKATTVTTSTPSVTVRPVLATDKAAFVSFVSAVPDGERRFLKEDLADASSAFASFLEDERKRRLVAVDAAGDVVGIAGAFPGTGWSSHVAELRVLVAPAIRGKGIGRTLARAVLVEALRSGSTHAYVEVVAQQQALVAMFQDLGFDPEALLVDFVRDAAGDFHDLMILTHHASELWSRQEILGLDEGGE